MTKKNKTVPKPEPTLAQIIRRRRNRLLDREEAWALVRRIVLIALAGWLLLTQVFMVMQIEGMNMFPAVKDGDLAIVYRLQQEYTRGDVVIFRVDGQQYVGRIAAKGTDRVVIKQNGKVLVNDNEQSGEILYSTYPRGEEDIDLIVPADSLYILGDYRTQTQDSRDWGPIPLEDVEGKVLTILRRRGL